MQQENGKDQRKHKQAKSENSLLLFQNNDIVKLLT